MPKMVIFDFDGTIAYSWAAMEYCYKETFKAFGRDVENEDFLSGFVGDLHSNLSRMLYIDGEELDKAVLIFRKAFEGEGHTKSRPYENIFDAIRQLHSEGYLLGIASMVYEPYLNDTLEAWGISELFTCACGSDKDSSIPKTDMIRKCLLTANVDEKDAVMIGDGYNDQNAARKTGVRFIAAVYGFGITKDTAIEEGYAYVERCRDIPDAVHRIFNG